MHERIEEVIGLVDDKSLKTVIERLMSKHHETFIEQPAGCSMHHAYDGGLLDHSCDTAITANALVERYSGLYKGINRSLVVAGAFLHDIGKIKCYEPREPNPNKPNSPKYKSSLKSRWHHHIPIGFHLIATETDALVESKKMEEELADHLLHIIISHHGRIDYRSNRTPDTREAFLVSQADLIDAYLGAPVGVRGTYNK